jgi:glutathione synthase/RimK-type ligase-like ATP-grasp enzyme
MNPGSAARYFAHPEAHAPLMGVAKLMTMAFHGTDLNDLRSRLVNRAQDDARDANALMDLATIMQLHAHRAIGLAIQAEALRIRRLYHLPSARWPAAIRVLAIMAPGDLATNMPLEFLVQDSDIALDMLYVLPGEPFPAVVPDHDLLIVAAGESDQNRPLLQQLVRETQTWPRPVLNRPERILTLSRAGACEMLRSAPGIAMPVAARVDRLTLHELARGARPLRTVLSDGEFPIIARPVDSHAGHGLVRIDAPAQIAAYLQTMNEAEFYIARFVDYRSADGRFRKYRVVLIDGRPYASHMGVSDQWMIHYLNAGMTENAVSRAEEERFMATFDAGFARRHEMALHAIARRAKLDYLVIDCGETRGGELLIFEVDSSAVVHAMDPVDLFPYKQPQMRRVFKAFRAMLAKAKAVGGLTAAQRNLAPAPGVHPERRVRRSMGQSTLDSGNPGVAKPPYRRQTDRPDHVAE